MVVTVQSKRLSDTAKKLWDVIVLRQPGSFQMRFDRLPEAEVKQLKEGKKYDLVFSKGAKKKTQ